MSYHLVSALTQELNPTSDPSYVAKTLHIKSCLELVVKGNYSAAVNYHQQAKAADKTVVPPLAALHLEENECGGISDIFFVGAVIIKGLANVDEAATIPRVMDMEERRPASKEVADQVYKGFETLVTLSFDSGLHHETEALVKRAIDLLSVGVNSTTQSYSDKQKLLALRIRSTLLTPAVFESKKHLKESRRVLVDRITKLARDISSTKREDRVTLARLDEFVVSPTFYFVYQGYKDKMLLSYLHEVYSSAFPDLNDVHVEKGHLSPYIGTRRKKESLRTLSDREKERESAARELDTSDMSDPEGADAEEIQELERLAKVHAQKADKKGKEKAARRDLEDWRRNAPLRVGFVSAYFRRHSICKLFCGIISGVASLPTPKGERRLDVLAFSSLQESHEDDTTKDLIAALPGGQDSFVRVGKTVILNRKEVTSRLVDVLVFLDIGMDPSTMIWASARLAPIQVCLWGHPTTTGLSHMDYFASSAAYHRYEEDNFSDYSLELLRANEEDEGGLLDKTNFVSSGSSLDKAHMMTEYPPPSPSFDRFSEQLLMFDTLGFHFKKPRVDANAEIAHEGLRKVLEGKKSFGTKLVLFPQHLPKLHPDMDEIFREILVEVPNAQLILVFAASKRLQWKRTVERRWMREDSISQAMMEALGDHDESRIIWLDNLKPHEYLALLAAGDIMLDPFPFGGGVTTLESLAVCTPVITYPGAQTVPALAAGMLDEIHLNSSGLIVKSAAEYIDTAVALLGGAQDEVSPHLLELRAHICKKHDILYSNQRAVQEWGDFIWSLH